MLALASNNALAIFTLPKLPHASINGVHPSYQQIIRKQVSIIRSNRVRRIQPNHSNTSSCSSTRTPGLPSKLRTISNFLLFTALINSNDVAIADSNGVVEMIGFCVVGEIWPTNQNYTPGTRWLFGCIYRVIRWSKLYVTVIIPRRNVRGM